MILLEGVRQLYNDVNIETIRRLKQINHTTLASTRSEHDKLSEKIEIDDLYSALNDNRQMLMQLAGKNEEQISTIARLINYVDEGIIELLEDLQDDNSELNPEEVEQTIELLNGDGKAIVGELSDECNNSFNAAPPAIKKQVRLIVSYITDLYNKIVADIADCLKMSYHEPRIG